MICRMKSDAFLSSLNAWPLMMMDVSRDSNWSGDRFSAFNCYNKPLSSCYTCVGEQETRTESVSWDKLSKTLVLTQPLATRFWETKSLSVSKLIVLFAFCIVDGLWRYCVIFILSAFKNIRKLVGIFWLEIRLCVMIFLRFEFWGLEVWGVLVEFL